MCIKESYKRVMNESKNVGFFLFFYLQLWLSASDGRDSTAANGFVSCVIHESAEFVTHTDSAYLLIEPSFRPECLKTDVQKNRMLRARGLFSF